MLWNPRTFILQDWNMQLLGPAFMNAIVNRRMSFNICLIFMTIKYAFLVKWLQCLFCQFCYTFILAMYSALEFIRWKGKKTSLKLNTMQYQNQFTGISVLFAFFTVHFLDYRLFLYNTTHSQLLKLCKDKKNFEFCIKPSLFLSRNKDWT